MVQKEDKTATFSKRACASEICAGYEYFALEYLGRECFCGKQNEKLNKYGISNQCVNGHGGFYAMDIYKVPDALGKNIFKLFTHYLFS